MVIDILEKTRATRKVPDEQKKENFPLANAISILDSSNNHPVIFEVSHRCNMQYVILLPPEMPGWSILAFISARAYPLAPLETDIAFD